ncbi:TetR/AcrR family transcriptional regulator [Bombiscardovia coagulans]|uniref:TetR family transcriptional regulator n=1 Tax=Bombiscardovia coagulans TaxID=686666 RepID=A0A261ETL6_9BIFI|nr:TetR/AcrR family transcriptional regulator [Bombiscardovia coagulans]OZG49996.1 TetR family transcriptional regulator [Bombiscardovia coagulans]
MATKQPEVTEQTRQRLEDAFWQLYKNQPIEKITIQQVTHLAGYHRATFYLYYRNLRELLNDIEDSLLDEREQFIDIHFTEQTPLETLREEITAFLTSKQSDIQYFKVLLGPHGDPAFVSRLNSMVKTAVQAYLTLTSTSVQSDSSIQTGQKTNLQADERKSSRSESNTPNYLLSTPQTLVDDSDATTRLDYLAEFFAAGKLGLVRKWLDDPEHNSVDYLVTLFIDILQGAALDIGQYKSKILEHD